ncbi:hypothetical protein ACJMK2_026878 [Sinanodonta woodiana]|uniref:Uncharacterized protein n=1 Tax=Sinanodonta woodiana TaxID=1069815 RepID=A0ABD3XMU3_SINWO
MNKEQILCFLLQLTVVMSATIATNGILTDITPMSTMLETSTTMLPDTTTTTTSTTTGSSTTKWQCIYNGKIYKNGDTFSIKGVCETYCWCTDSHLICTMCPSTTTEPPSTTTTPLDISTTTVPGKCLYNGQIYNDGDFIITNNSCHSDCWCIDSELLCTPCPPSTSTPETSGTILPDTTTTTTSTTTGSSTTIRQCIYNGQIYENGDEFITEGVCQNYCWCIDSQLICTMCPSTTTETTISNTEPSTTTTTTAPPSSTILTIIPTITIPGKCYYNGKIYSEGDLVVADNYCQSFCWCTDSQLICTLCPPSTPKSTISSTDLSTTTTTTEPPSTTTTSPGLSSTTVPGKCYYNGKIYNDGDLFIANNSCQSYCWCIDSRLLCSLCPPSTSKSTLRSTEPSTTTSTTESTLRSTEPSTTRTTTESTLSSTERSTTTTTTAPPSSTTISPDLSTTTDTETKRRIKTVLPPLSTKTKKFRTDLFNTITKKPHFTTRGSQESGSITPKDKA